MHLALLSVHGNVNPKPSMLLPFLHKIASGEDLSAAEAREAMLAILSGDGHHAPNFGVSHGPADERRNMPRNCSGFARAMREKTTRIDACVDPEPLLDTCGTGGGAGSTFNISTVAAFVVAGAGVRVAKHGNRSFSTQCGSADMLEQLGVDVSQPPERVAQAIREIGIGFLFAPLLHPAMKHAQPARAELKMRTVFNLLGPLTNPAGATRQLIGAPSVHAAELMANALAGLGPERAFVVHGGWTGRSDHHRTHRWSSRSLASSVRSFQWTPADFGVAAGTHRRSARRRSRAQCRNRDGGFERPAGPQRDIVLVNSAAALLASGIADGPRDAMERAAESIDSGAAWTQSCASARRRSARG